MHSIDTHWVLITRAAWMQPRALSANDNLLALMIHASAAVLSAQEGDRMEVPHGWVDHGGGVES